MSKKKENKTVINNWNFGYLFGESPMRVIVLFFKWILLLIVITSIFSLVMPFSNKVSENKEVYDICMNGCQSDLKIAKLSYDFVNPPNEHSTNIAINRVGCLEECNNMYLRLRNT